MQVSIISTRKIKGQRIKELLTVQLDMTERIKENAGKVNARTRLRMKNETPR